jgi:hypothetical protein
MSKFFSRRTFLLGAGGGLSVSLAWSCRGSRRELRRAIDPDPAFDPFDKYIDDRGWMLDARDKKIVRPA